MKEDKIKKIVMLVVIIIIVAILSIVLVNREDSKVQTSENDKETYVELGIRTRQNISEKVKEEREFDGLILQNADITYSNKISTFSVVIANKKDTEYEEKNIEIVFVDQNDQVINTIKTQIPTITAKGVITLNASIENDISQAYNYFITEI